MDKTYGIVEMLLKTFAFIVIIGVVLKIVHLPGAEIVLKTGIYGGIALLVYQNHKLKAFVKSVQQPDSIQ